MNGFFNKANNLINKEACFGLIERRTGGNLRRTFGWQENFTKKLTRIKEGKIKKIDIGHINSCTKEQ